MRGSRSAILVAWLSALLLASVWAAGPGSPLPDAELVAALQRGGNVIYFRHADTGLASPEPATVDLTRCETQRNLNDKGRAEAVEVGKQFRRLHIPVGAVLSSQFCRCKETAELSFGRFDIVPSLTGVACGPEFAQARLDASAGLRALLAATPPEGENTVLVSHGFNLIDLEQLYLSTQGEAAIYRPDGAGGYSLLARVLPSQWSQLQTTE